MIPPVSDDDLYLLATINRHRASDDDSTTHRLRRLIASLLRRWTYSNHLESVTVSGSHAKATALRDSDLDLFLSLSPSTPGPLSSIHASLAGHFRGCLPLTRNVSVRIMFEGAGIDLVPGRRRPDSTVHTLWQSRYATWLQTDIAAQARFVLHSGLVNEILALKLWRRRNALRFPSFLMELATIHALAPNRPISESFLSLLRFLATGFRATRLIDSANSNNVVSDLLTPDEKSRIAIAAAMSLRAPSWPEII